MAPEQCIDELKKQLRERTIKLHTAEMQKALLQVVID
jgi:hypothetical protein